MFMINRWKGRCIAFSPLGPT